MAWLRMALMLVHSLFRDHILGLAVAHVVALAFLAPHRPTGTPSDLSDLQEAERACTSRVCVSSLTLRGRGVIISTALQRRPCPQQRAFLLGF